jgi:predicted nucleotidyltransferase
MEITMKVAGIIVEYNPFHNGHKFHIEQTKKLTGADYIIAVMSGNYVQRGEPAVINKYLRTDMALLNGVDLCIELPTCYSSASAEFFAYGAVSILHKLGIVDYVCFGSEAGSIKHLDYIADILNSNNKEYQTILNKYIKQGNSYPKARELGILEYLKSIKSPYLKEIKKIISSPNNILGIEYIKALKKLGSSITPITITRTDKGYNEINLDKTSSYTSASSIRTNIHTLASIKKYVPSNVYSILKQEQIKLF